MTISDLQGLTVACCTIACASLALSLAVWLYVRQTRHMRRELAVRLLSEAMLLRVNGEYAPGGGENWRDWERKTERLLRDISGGHT